VRESRAGKGEWCGLGVRGGGVGDHGVESRWLQRGANYAIQDGNLAAVSVELVCTVPGNWGGFQSERARGVLLRYCIRIIL
jgi:hypothetical protein